MVSQINKAAQNKAKERKQLRAAQDVSPKRKEKKNCRKKQIGEAQPLPVKEPSRRRAQPWPHKSSQASLPSLPPNQPNQTQTTKSAEKKKKKMKRGRN
jgi:hypothetical protein